MQMNTTKTKEMILGPLSRSAIPEQSTEGGSTERVLSFKLLKFYVEYIALFRRLVITCWSYGEKATQRLYFLKQLKRAGLLSNHIFHIYCTVIRPVLEYCVPVWHYALTKARTGQLKAVQKTAIHIILKFSRGMPFMYMLQLISLLWPLIEKISPVNSSFKSKNPLLVCINFFLI